MEAAFFTKMKTESLPRVQWSREPAYLNQQICNPKGQCIRHQNIMKKYYEKMKEIVRDD